MKFLINFFAGIFAHELLIKDIISKNTIDPNNNWNILKYIAFMIPPCSFLASLIGFLQIAGENQKCKMSTTPSDMAETYKSE